MLGTELEVVYTLHADFRPATLHDNVAMPLHYLQMKGSTQYGVLHIHLEVRLTEDFVHTSRCKGKSELQYLCGHGSVYCSCFQ